MVPTFVILLTLLGMGQTIENKTVLVFGGNGFLGASTVLKLLQDGHIVTIVNRGNWYWDTHDTIHQKVNHITCDRYSRDQALLEKSCPDLVSFVKSAKTIDFVVDFSAFDSKAVSEALKILGTKPSVYIYISTDSVYEVVDKGHSRPSREEDAKRPQDKLLRDTLAENDNYGHEKLAAEEVLVEAKKQNKGPQYILLRLPDVIGPRDNTDRWWQYQLWLRLSEHLNKPVGLPSHLKGQPLSLVYVEDVANLMRTIVSDPDESVLGTAYNLAFEETFFLSDIVRAIRNEIGAKSAAIQWEEAQTPYFLYPSVQNGPVNVTKAYSTLGWKTTPWEEVVKTTTTFYEDVFKRTDKFSWHIGKVLHKLKYNLFQGMETKVDRVLTEIYGYKRAKDEL